jgi:hypothetical protein
MVWAVEVRAKVVPLLSRIPIERILVERGRHVNNDGRIGVDGKRHMTMHQPRLKPLVDQCFSTTPTLLYYSAICRRQNWSGVGVDLCRSP